MLPITSNLFHLVLLWWNECFVMIVCCNSLSLAVTAELSRVLTSGLNDAKQQMKSDVEPASPSRLPALRVRSILQRAEMCHSLHLEPKKVSLIVFILLLQPINQSCWIFACQAKVLRTWKASGTFRPSSIPKCFNLIKLTCSAFTRVGKKHALSVTISLCL